MHRYWCADGQANTCLRSDGIVGHNANMANSESQHLQNEVTGQPALRAPKPRDARAVRSGLALREALLALLLQKPFDQITVREICAHADVHYATFFRHHTTKEELLDDIAEDQIRHLVALTLAIRNHESYQSGFRALCVYVAEHRSLWATLLNGGAGSTMREEWVRQSLEVAAAETPVHDWLPIQLGTICAATLIAETLAWWVAQPEAAYSVDDVAAILSRLLMGTIIAPE